MTSIVVQVLPGKHDTLLQKLEEIRKQGQHLFPGTIVRLIMESEANPGQLEITLVWRSTVMPEETERQQALEAFRQTLADVLDWKTAQYNHGKVLMHT